MKVLVLVLVELSVGPWLRLTLVLLMLGVVRREMGLVQEVVLLRTVLLLDEGVENLSVVQTGWRGAGEAMHPGLPLKLLKNEYNKITIK